MNIRKQKKGLSEIKIAIFISDVGFGHMARQRCIIRELEKQFLNCKILIINRSVIDIIEQTFKEKHTYLNLYNNITLFKTKSGYFNKAKTNQQFKKWFKNKNKIFKLKTKLKNFDLIISDFVPEAFELAKELKIKSYGVCHYTWSWFFEKTNYKNKNEIRILKEIESKANKIFFPPFTPKDIFFNLEQKKYKKINFITEKKNNKKFSKNNKPIVLIMDNGTRTLNKKISQTLPEIKKNKKFHFYIGTNSLDKNHKNFILNADNITPVLGLKSIYEQILKSDLVIARGGFNTISECLIYKKAALISEEKNNPEITSNLKIIFKQKIAGEMKFSHWGKNFNQRLEQFYRFEKNKIEKKIEKLNYLSNGSIQVVNYIKKEFENGKNNC